ncbi:hypothetical protein COS83_05090 [archaeon CG07_land_8_20_14_0_80_38_8]|nr:MAG: hypothetical protein COS83_05090 [archaeon CG07_land_8_20_14_0_80_38_8]PIU88314.1 MAG: hypothetical protein COS64_04030 [archaeon CG06_land_8_20_14_3_00_37_11]
MNLSKFIETIKDKEFSLEELENLGLTYSSEFSYKNNEPLYLFSKNEHYLKFRKNNQEKYVFNHL